MYRLTFTCILISSLIGISNCVSIREFSRQDGFVFPGQADRPLSVTFRPTAKTTQPSTSREVGGSSTLATVNFDNCYNQCPTTSEYNPMCGTDEVTYNNPGRFNCARACGKRVEVQYQGMCRTNN